MYDFVYPYGVDSFIMMLHIGKFFIKRFLAVPGRLKQMISSGVTDLSQLQTKDITTTGQVMDYGDGKLYVSYALDPNDPESNRVREVTPEEAAKITTRQIMGDEGNNPQIVKTIEGIITGNK